MLIKCTRLYTGVDGNRFVRRQVLRLLLLCVRCNHSNIVTMATLVVVVVVVVHLVIGYQRPSVITVFSAIRQPIITHITGCAVAQHCYNGDVSFLWEKWKL